MLDLVLFRTYAGGSPEEVRESQRRRGADVAVVDAIIAADELWRTRRHESQSASARLAKAKAAGRGRSKSEAAPLEAGGTSREELKALSQASSAALAAQDAAQRSLQSLLLSVGNLVHEDVPVAAPMLRPAACRPGGHRGPLDAHREALNCLVAAGLAELLPSSATACSGRAWKPCGAGLLLQHGWLAHALRLVAARGYAVLSSPTRPAADRLAKFERLCRERGDTPPCAIGATDPLGAQHACSWLPPAELPRRYAVAHAPQSSEDVTVAGTSAIAAANELWLSVACVDDGSCWSILDELTALAEELHTELHGLALATRDVCAADLTLSEARAMELCVLPRVEGETPATGAAASGSMEGDASIVLAHAACEYDYDGRRLGMRCGFKSVGEREKRHVHTLRACLFQPSATLLALGAQAAAQGVYSPLDVLPAHLRAQWGV
jgi:seryl-tRNA synthetase